MSRTRLLLLSAAALVVGAALALVLARSSDYMDLAVYRWAGTVAFDDTQLYAVAHPTYALRFTYTPFAAAAFAVAEPVALLTPVVWTLVSLAALVRSSVLVARRIDASLLGVTPRAMALIVLVATLMLEPTVEGFRLGQVGLVLGWLVLEDLLGPQRRWSGALVGIASGIKLTPAIYLLLLVVTRRMRAALVGAAALAATIVVGFVALPAESRSFWSGAFFEAGRAGAVEFVGNQSINGVLWRLLGEGGSRSLWVVSSLAAVGACLALARRYHAAGEELVSVGLGSLAGLLASPISWTHHWVLIVPLLAGLAFTPRATRITRAVVAVGFLVLASRIVWRVPHANHLEFAHTPLQQLAGASYVLVGGALLLVAFVMRPRIGDAR